MQVVDRTSLMAMVLEQLKNDTLLAVTAEEVLATAGMHEYLRVEEIGEGRFVMRTLSYDLEEPEDFKIVRGGE